MTPAAHTPRNHGLDMEEQGVFALRRGPQAAYFYIELTGERGTVTYHQRRAPQVEKHTDKDTLRREYKRLLDAGFKPVS